MSEPRGRNARVWAVVCAIPPGRVASYKQVAALAHIEGPSGARQVGYALAALPDGSDVPWHRVVNVKGTLALRAHYLYLVDPRGDWMMRFPADVDFTKAKRDLTRLLKASEAWDEAGRP